MLTKKDKKKRYNKRTHSLKGHEFSAISEQMTKDTQSAFKGSNFGGAIGGLASAATGAIDAGMKNAELQGVEEAQEAIDARQNFQSTANTNNDLLAEMAAATNAKSDYTHKDFMQDGKTLAMNTINATMQGAASGASAGPWGAVAGAAAGLLGGIGGIIGGRVKAGVEAAEKSEAAKRANEAQAQTLTAKAGALDQDADARALAAYAAYGGGINAPKFSDFPSEVTEFNTGGSHEENPYDGIPQGIAPDGLPNLVEEGEVKYDNYIFSDRLMLNKNDKKKYKFLKGKTYADAAKAIKKELGIDERPNDLIAKADLEEQLNLLSTLQEEERAKRGLRGENRMMYAKGGHLFAGSKNTNNGFYLFDTAEEAAKAGLDYVPPRIDGVLDGISADNSALKKLDKFNYSIFGAKPKDGINKGLKFTELDLSTDRPGYTTKKSKTNNPGNWGSSLLQSMPAIGSAIGTIASIFDRPTYEHTKKLTQAETPITPITYTPTHQDIRLPRFDKSFYMNKADAQAAATRRAIREQTASNPYASTAALLTADAQASNTRGDIRRQAEEMNANLALQEAQFNSTGRRADAEGLLKAASTNATLQDRALTRQAEKDAMAARLNLAEDQAWDAANSANLTGLFDNLGAIGKEDQEFALAAMKIFGEGKVTPEMQAMMLPRLQKILAKAGYKYGGKLRKKKGYTI